MNNSTLPSRAFPPPLHRNKQPINTPLSVTDVTYTKWPVHQNVWLIGYGRKATIFFPIRIYSYIFIHTNIFMNSVMCVCVHVREHVIIVIGSSVNV